jgi:NHLM bacteriocin system ABC transporter peptidase/ATP-binding protein
MPATRPRALSRWFGWARIRRRVRVPTIMQMEAVECGAASLAMILAHFGRIVRLEELRVACGVSRDGSRAQSILKAARHYGLVAKAYRKEVSELAGLQPPFVIHSSFNHFLVVEGIGRRHVYLNDPATGPRTVTHTEFDNSFTGVVLTFTTSPEFATGGQRPRLSRSLHSRLAGSGGAFLALGVIGVLAMLTGIVTPAFMTIFIDDVLLKGVRTWAAPLELAIVATAVLLGVLTYFQQRYANKLELRLSLSMSSRLVSHMLTLPIGFFLQRGTGELSTRVALNDRVAQVLSGELISGLLAIFALAFYISFMFEYDFWLTVVMIGTTALNVAAVQFAARRRVNLTRRLSQDQGKMMGTAIGGLQSIETLKAMGGESDFFSRWSGFQSKVLSVQQQVKLQTELLALVPVALTALNTVLILAVGGHRVMSGSLSIGMLIAFQSFVLMLAPPIQQLAACGNSLPEVEGQLGRLEDVLETAPDPQVNAPPVVDDEGRPRGTKMTGLVELQNVTFGYNPTEPPLISDFNLTLAPGSRVALVGGSGSGKSTVARLVCGLYRPWSGDILFDGVPLERWSHHERSHSFAVVDQEVFLFEGTVRDNLTLWDSTVPERDVVRACVDASIHGEVMARPGGYSSGVEEGGRNFSGGQRQRMEIARALATNPSILVLDEATSALDPTTEKIVDDNLRRRGCTCLIVAHRLSTIRDCDEILVLDKGKIVQRGTHDEMVAAAGPYQSLISAEG